MKKYRWLTCKVNIKNKNEADAAVLKVMESAAFINGPEVKRIHDRTTKLP